ncbi:MAG: hypothetical protein ABI672_03760 [Vicinamibacteria bacterium]
MSSEKRFLPKYVSKSFAAGLLVIACATALTAAPLAHPLDDGWIDYLSVGYSGEAEALQTAAVARHKGVLSVSRSLTGTVNLSCGGGASASNADSDIYITITIYVDSSPVASANGYGPHPTAYAGTTIPAVSYNRSVTCDLAGPFNTVQADDTIVGS